MISEKIYQPPEKPEEDDIYKLYDKALELIEVLKENDRTNKLKVELDDFLDKDNKEGIKGIIRQAEDIFRKTMALEKKPLFDNERFSYNGNLNPEEIKNLEGAELEVRKLAIESNFIGDGRTARVYENEKFPEYCFKIIFDRNEYDLGRDVSGEAEIMERIKNLQVEGIRIPKLFSCHMTKKMHFLVMERISGCTLQEILDGKKHIPEGADWKKLFNNLKKFVQAMNEAGVYHGDFLAKNVMYDFNSKNLVIIDFGRGRFKKDDFNSDLEGVFEIRKEFRKKFGKELH
jgi:tRNA A-37 threonylcarbamoyl transferase component Bud32